MKGCHLLHLLDLMSGNLSLVTELLPTQASSVSLLASVNKKGQKTEWNGEALLGPVAPTSVKSPFN